MRGHERSCYREGLDEYEEQSTGAKKKTAVRSRASNAGVRGNKKQAEVVTKLLTKMEQKLGTDEVKASLADYIRLVQLKKELDEDEPREIRVKWVEPETADQDSKSKT